MNREEIIDVLLDLIIKNSSNNEDAKESARQMSYTPQDEKRMHKYKQRYRRENK